MAYSDAKSWLASKTLWLNGLTIVATILVALTKSDLVPADVAPYIVAALAAVNFALRFLTDSPLAKIGG